MVATIIGTQNKYEKNKLRFFSKYDPNNPEYKDPIINATNTLTYWDYMAKLALGDFE